MQLTANHIHFFISYAIAFLAFGLIGKWYVWPLIKDRALKPALTPLLLYACLRVNGLMFLMPGLVSPDSSASSRSPCRSSGCRTRSRRRRARARAPSSHSFRPRCGGCSSTLDALLDEARGASYSGLAPQSTVGGVLCEATSRSSPS